MQADEATVDLERQVVAFDGRRGPVRDQRRDPERLLSGLDDIALTLQHGDDIDRFEDAAACPAGSLDHIGARLTAACSSLLRLRTTRRPASRRPSRRGRVVEPARTVVPVEREYALDPALAEKIDRASFWSRSGPRPRSPAAILGVIALFVALDARDKADSDGGGNAGLQSDVNQLQSDVEPARAPGVLGRPGVRPATSTRSSPTIEDQLKQISDDQQQQAQDIADAAAGRHRAERPRGPGRAGAGRRGRRRAHSRRRAKSSPCRATASAPRSSAPALQLLRRARPAVRRRLRGRAERPWAASRSTSTACRCCPRCSSAAAPPTRCCWAPSAARSGTRPIPTRRARAGPAGPAQGPRLFANLRPVRVVPALLGRQPAARGARARRRPDDRARADGRHLLRRPRPPRRRRARHVRVLGRGGRADRASWRSRSRPRPSRRGQVVSVDKANILETSRLWRETVERVAARLPRRAARAHAGRQRSHAADRAARATSTSC